MQQREPGSLDPPEMRTPNAKWAWFVPSRSHPVPVQAISMMGMKGVAKKVDFNPVRAQDVALPPGVTFVVANSLSVSNKAVGAHRRWGGAALGQCGLAWVVLWQLRSFCKCCSSTRTPRLWWPTRWQPATRRWVRTAGGRGFQGRGVEPGLRG